jgi:hypothetical protein
MGTEDITVATLALMVMGMGLVGFALGWLGGLREVEKCAAEEFERGFEAGARCGVEMAAKAGTCRPVGLRQIKDEGGTDGGEDDASGAGVAMPS